VRVGPAHLPRPGPDRSGLHDRSRVRRHGARRGRSGHERVRGGPRARLLPHRLRPLFLLHARLVHEVRPGAGVRPRGDARLPSGNAGGPGARADREPDAKACARWSVGRGGPVRGRRDGYGLPRGDRCGRARRRPGRRPRPRTGRAVCRPGRARRGRGERRRDRRRGGSTRDGALVRRGAGAPDRGRPARTCEEGDRRARQTSSRSTPWRIDSRWRARSARSRCT